MDWKKLIAELLAVGMTQKQIALHIGVGQSRVSQVLSDEAAGFGYEPGKRLVELHTELVLAGVSEKDPA